MLDGLRHDYLTREGERIRACEIDHLEIQERELVCIVGPSGCGKTTVLQIVAGLIRPTHGTVTIGGRAITGPGADRGVVFQQPSLFPWLTVGENVQFGPRMAGMSKKERQQLAQSKLALVGLGQLAGRRTYELSGGMQQRVAIARALANEPSILLMDEPFGALDALTRDQMQEELLTLWRATRTTILFVTHNVEEAAYLGTRILVMSPGPGRIVVDRRSGIPYIGDSDPREVRLRDDFLATREAVLAGIYQHP
jgi:ABC-type taurine transport system ATPase subunit